MKATHDESTVLSVKKLCHLRFFSFKPAQFTKSILFLLIELIDADNVVLTIRATNLRLAARLALASQTHDQASGDLVQRNVHARGNHIVVRDYLDLGHLAEHFFVARLVHLVNDQV